jgi:hypothetical protein
MQMQQIIQQQQMEQRQQHFPVNIASVPQRQFAPSGPAGGMTGGYGSPSTNFLPSQSTPVLPPIVGAGYGNVAYDPYVPSYQQSYAQQRQRQDSAYSTPRIPSQGISPGKSPKYSAEKLQARGVTYKNPQQWR